MRPCSMLGVSLMLVLAGCSASPTECAEAQILCGSGCVDVLADAAHCGACDQPCAEGSICSAGSCKKSCSEGQSQCGAECVSLRTDRANCGGCGASCADGMVCSEGQCKMLCQSGLSSCGDSCIDTRDNPAHCGSCGNVCSNGRTCSSGACTRRVFVTSQLYAANLGGLAGADAKCQALADAAGIGGTYRAWLSVDSNSSPATRFTRSPGAYALVDGTVIATSWSDLVDGTLQNPIRLTERGGAPPTSTDSCGFASVWTNTGADGAGFADGAMYSCSNFTELTGRSQLGRHDVTGSNWSQACTSSPLSCSLRSPLFCFEQ